MASNDSSSTSSSFSKTFSEIRKSLKEDAPTNSVASGGVSGLTGIPPVPSKIMPILRRKKKKALPEDLRKWFQQDWVRMDTKGNIKGQCARDEGEGKPKCLPRSKAQSLGKEGRAKAARRKRREDPVADRKGKGQKPVMVATEDNLMEKNVPTNPELWSKVKAMTKRKFDVYPSAYANAFASKEYKKRGGGWKSVSEEVEAGPHIGTIVKKISSAAARLNKKTKFPLDRYREVQGRLYRHPPSGPRAKASRAAYEVMHKKGYDPYFDPNEENENTYAFHTAGKKLPTKPRKVQDMMPADEYPPHPAINEEIEDYVVAFTLPVFIRTLEIARETLKDDDELHMFVEDLVNLQGDDILTMQDVEEVFEKYKGD
jgi:hypothetical protein